MSGHAIAGAAALAGHGSGKYDRARMSKVHDELWSKSDAAKVLIDSASGRSKDLSTSQLTISATMGEDTGLLYLTGVVGPNVLYDVELTGMQYRPNRLRGLWEKLLSKATLVADDDERCSFLSRRDSFTRKTGLMSETTEVPWDIQVQVRAAGLWRRIRTQRNTLAGKSFTKPLLAGTARQALRRHMDLLGVRQEAGAH